MTQDVEWTFEGPVGDVIAAQGVDVKEVAIPVLKQFAVDCDIAPEAAERALMDVRAFKYHPMEDWIRGLPAWDGEDRLRAIADGLPSPNPQDYLRAVIKRWFIQAVQAVCGWREPKQVPHVLCFSGPQGTLKTTWVMTCVPPQFATEGVTLSITGDPAKDRDSIRAASQTPIVELGELETTFSKSSNEAQKNYLSRTHDTYRLSYGRREVTYPRCTIYAGTLNGTGFLHDETGSRRFWPIAITDQLTLIAKDDLQQVWAQALHLWQSGESWFLNDSERAMHGEIVAYHAEGDTTEDLLEETFKDGFWSRPAGQDASVEDPYYELVSVTEIAQKLGIARPTKTERRLIRHWAERHGGVLGQFVPHPIHRKADGTPNARRKRVFMALAVMPEYLKNKNGAVVPPPFPNGTWFGSGGLPVK